MICEALARAKPAIPIRLHCSLDSFASDLIVPTSAKQLQQQQICSLHLRGSWSRTPCPRQSREAVSPAAFLPAPCCSDTSASEPMYKRNEHIYWAHLPPPIRCKYCFHTHTTIPLRLPVHAMPKRVLDIWRRLATFTEQGEINDAAVFVRGNAVEWVGRDADLPAPLSEADTVLELRDHVMIPGSRRQHAYVVKTTS